MPFLCFIFAFPFFLQTGNSFLKMAAKV